MMNAQDNQNKQAKAEQSVKSGSDLAPAANSGSTLASDGNPGNSLSPDANPGSNLSPDGNASSNMESHSGKTGDRATLSGMQAASYAAYALSDVATIFPITPASHMSEQIEKWSVDGRKNLMGQQVTVKEMQSEKGAAGALHGALSGGALASTFTASQGLMLMIPNMYKIAGELLPGVFHVTCRSLATHALSIFGDHQDLMATRATGVAMLGSSSVQECMDLSLVAHLSAIEGSLPFAHFMDGFRTSDEIETIEIISQDDMGKLVDWQAVKRFRDRAMDPLHPMARGTAQNSDIYFQSTEAANRYHDALPQIVQRNMDKVGEVTGREYHLFDYVGHPQAEKVIVCMGSACDVVDETVRYMVQNGEKVGVVKVRLYRPFSTEAFIAAVPSTCRILCALDRTKEPGSQGEPLLQDVVQAVFDGWRNKGAADDPAGDSGEESPDNASAVSSNNSSNTSASNPPMPDVIGGRYGLSSKDFTPSMVNDVFRNMDAVLHGTKTAGSFASANEGEDAAEGKRRFTVGIIDDITNLSLLSGPQIDTLPKNTYQAMFYGFGSDGTVGANKQTVRLLGQLSGKWAQEYSWFDSKKSGGLTISYMRIADNPIHSPYLIENADYIACHKNIYVSRGYPMADKLREGGVFVLNSSWDEKEIDAQFPPALKHAIASKHARLYNVDATAIAEKAGLGKRINMVMEVAFLKLMLDSNISPSNLTFEDAINALKADVKVMYASKGANVVEANIKAIDGAIDALKEIHYPKSWAKVDSSRSSLDEQKSTSPGQSSASPSSSAKRSTESKATTPGLSSPNSFASNGFASEPDQPATAYDPQSKFIQEVFWPMEKLRGDSLPTSKMSPDGFFPLGGTAHEKRTVAINVPRWDPNACIQCFQCSFVCPHAAIRPYLATDDELQGAPDTFATVPAKRKEFAGLNLRIQNYPQDCTGCGSCAFNCPAPGKALFMEPLSGQIDAQKQNLLYAQENISLKPELLPNDSVQGTQLRQPLLEFSSCCAGCGETPHVKLLTQLFGERMLIANATGCSSIWGGYAPAMPYCKALDGRGPAWGNSLFEDNAEYGYGMLKAVKQRRAKLVELCEGYVAASTDPVASLMQQWLKQREDPDASYDLGEAIKAELERIPEFRRTDVQKQILDSADMFQKKSIWAIGGDGWAFDIDYGGLDEVLASKENINVLVLDTEGYSNTGGEMSKSTQLGSVSTFSLLGKDTPKKRLARMAMQYDYVYVAQVCFGANMQQCITALREAEAYDGPSLVVALCPCISWGIKAGMGTAVGACRDAVKTSYWSLWRFDPDKLKAGQDPLTIDSKPANVDDASEQEAELRKYLMGQNRFARLADSHPDLSNTLQSELAKERATEDAEMCRMVDVYKS